jgi:hypothetical protein
MYICIYYVIILTGNGADISPCVNRMNVTIKKLSISITIITMDDNVLIGICVALLVGAVSVAVYLLYKQDPNDAPQWNAKENWEKDKNSNEFNTNEDYLQGLADESKMDDTQRQAALEKLISGNNVDLTKVKGHTDIYDWTQTEKEVGKFILFILYFYLN